MPEKVFYARNTDLAPLKDGQARAIDIFGAQLPDRSALVLKADADQLAEALQDCRTAILEARHPSGQYSRDYAKRLLNGALPKASAALAAYDGEGDD